MKILIRGNTTILLIIIAILLVGGGYYFYQYQQLENQIQKKEKNISNPLTEADLLNATYPIKVGFAPDREVRNITFPQLGFDRGIVRIEVPGGKPGSTNTITEGLWIYQYEFDSSKSNAKVYIVGNYGASENDYHVFLVTKNTSGLEVIDISDQPKDYLFKTKFSTE